MLLRNSIAFDSCNLMFQIFLLETGKRNKATCPSFLLTFLQIFGFAFEIYFPILPDLVWFNLCEDVYFAFFVLVQLISYTFHFGWKSLRYATLLASTWSCWVFVNIKLRKKIIFARVNDCKNLFWISWK